MTDSGQSVLGSRRKKGTRKPIDKLYVGSSAIANLHIQFVSSTVGFNSLTRAETSDIVLSSRVYY